METKTISIRVTEEDKERFFDMKNKSNAGTSSEFFQQLLDNSSKEREPVPEPLPLPQEEAEENIFDKDTFNELAEESPETKTEPGQTTDDNQPVKITLELSPVQAFAVRETILNNGFTDDVNEIVNKVDNAIDTSFFGRSIFSGDYKGIFTLMDLDPDEEESINKNIGVALINHFISAIVFGPGDLNTPVSQNMLKVFLQEQKADEPEED